VQVNKLFQEENNSSINALAYFSSVTTKSRKHAHPKETFSWYDELNGNTLPVTV